MIHTRTPDGLTHEQRTQSLNKTIIDTLAAHTIGDRVCPLHPDYKAKQAKHPPTSTKPNCACRQFYFMRRHLERLVLIYKPFPVVRKISAGGSALPWGGSRVNDSFYGGQDSVRRQLVRRTPEGDYDTDSYIRDADNIDLTWRGTDQ